MRTHLRFAVLFLITAFVFAGSSAQTFIHPGIDMCREDLELMKNKTLAGEQPWRGAFERLKAETPLSFEVKTYAHVISGPYGKPDIGGSDLSKGAVMAYNCAVLWYITKDKAYAEKAIEIIGKWSESLRSLDENNAKLLVALSGYKFCNAAEILRYTYPGWTENHTAAFTEMIMSVYYPLLRFYFPQANGNWDGAIMHTLLSIAIFTNDRPLFDNAVYHYLHGKANGSLIKYIFPNGQCQETTRDQGHVQMGLGEFAGAARIAYTQGVDLFSAGDNRLALGYEYTSRFLLGEDIFSYGEPSHRDKDLRNDYGIEYVYQHYKAQGIDMPYTRSICDKVRDKSSLILLTAFRAAFQGKTPEQRPLICSEIAYPAGALRVSDFKIPEDAIVVSPGDSLQQILDNEAGHKRTIFLKAGEYTMNKTLKIHSGTHLIGEGTKTVLMFTPSVRTAAIMAATPDMSDVVIENLIIEGAREHAAGFDPNAGRFERQRRYANNLAGISFRSEKNYTLSGITLRNLSVINFSRTGVYISGAKNVKIEACDFTENGTFVVPGPRLQHNLLLQRVDGGVVQDSRFDTSLHGAGVVLDHCRSLDLKDCEIARNAWHGVLLSECSGINISENLIEGNDGCGILSEFLYKGSSNLKIRKNRIRYNNGHGVEAFAVKNLSVSGNCYDRNGKLGAQEHLCSDLTLQMEKISVD